MDNHTSINARPLALLMALFALVAVALAPSRAAAADVTGGEAAWGFKESFRNYILNAPPPFPPASITPSNGASQAAGNGAFTFVDGTGALDPDSGTAGLDFTGTVTFSKPAHGINVVLENPRVEYSGATGVLIADVTDSGGTPNPDTQLANLDLTGLSPTVTDAGASLADIPATATANVQPLFGSYPEGTELDPVSFSVEGDFSTTPVDPYPERTAVGKVKPGKKSQKLKKSRTIKLGKVTCDVAECELAAPDKLKGKIKGGKKKDKLKLEVKAPDTLAEGESAVVKAKASKKSAKALEGDKAKLKGKLKLTGDGNPVAGKFKVTVRG